MLETIQSMSLLAIMEIVGPVLLAVAAGLRHCSGVAKIASCRKVSDEATRRLYREGQGGKAGPRHTATCSLGYGLK